MMYATSGVVSVDLACGKDNSFRASGSTVLIPGFLAVYEEGRDDKKKMVKAFTTELKEGDEPL